MYAVDLSADEQAELNALLGSGTHNEVSQAVGCHPGTAARIRKRYTEDGLAVITRRQADQIYNRKLDGLDGREEAHTMLSIPEREAIHRRFYKGCREKKKVNRNIERKPWTLMKQSQIS